MPPAAISKPDDYEARANLMWASSWTLNGFLGCGIIQAPMCHTIEHELSAIYDITHGHGLAIVTPHWLKLNFSVLMFSESILRFLIWTEQKKQSKR